MLGPGEEVSSASNPGELGKGIVRAKCDCMSAREHAIRYRPGSIERYISTSIWLFVAGVFFSLAGQWIIFSSDDRAFSEYTAGLLQRAAVDHRNNQEIRTLLLVKAEELSIPLRSDQIAIKRDRESIRTVIDYDTDIKIPIVNRVLYRMAFSHDLRYTASR